MEQHQGVGLYTGFFKNLNMQVKIRGLAYSRVYTVIYINLVIQCIIITSLQVSAINRD
ncbi:hypothetical protein LDENG_00187870 [Lucifuga dentata]|nr:hypothetical protein LDENG_00187870 [Lucifuga dentata]